MTGDTFAELRSTVGKQIGVYLTIADEQALLESLQAKADVVVVQNYFSTPDPPIVDIFQPVGTLGIYDYDLSIYNKDINPKLFVDDLPEGKHSLDKSRSEVIQFNRCVLRPDSTFTPGRLWYDHQTMSAKPKRKPFLTWAQSVLRLVKKSCHFSKDHFARYFGPEAW